ncbi:coiled-coil domain-containing protein [Serratia marcescens]|uniref:Uncharacterized protein n=1 Tax=Serratia marcescens TaxID=615 RepID=A0AAP8PI08_SERMA|nr:hypothetical protein [Serratia marcescens]PNO70169.1 hypothetical protein MC70_009205 [Serratia marcescens]
MSDSKDEGLIDSVKKTLIDRINTPLFGFIVLSWIVFNWELLLTVIFSKQMIATRIDFVKLSDYYPFKMFIYPAISGFVLSVAFPYCQWAVSFLQRIAQKLIDGNNLRRELAENNAVIALASSKADADNSRELERARKKLEIAMKEGEVAKVQLDTAELEKLHGNISGAIDKLKLEIKNQETLHENIKGDINVVQRRVDKLNSREKELLDSIANKENYNNSIHLLSHDIERVVDIVRGSVMLYRKKLRDEGVIFTGDNASSYFTVDIRELNDFIESIERGIGEIQLISTENASQVALNKN